MKKDNMNTAKVNKEIGGWDYKGFHISRNNKLLDVTEIVNGLYWGSAKTLGEAKKIADDVVVKAGKKADTEVVEFTSKRKVTYLIQIVNGKVKAFTYEAGKKRYWTVTKEIMDFVAAL